MLLAISATVQPLRVVQPDAVCEVGGSTPGISHGDLGIFLGGGQTEEFVHLLRNNRHTGDAPSNQPKVAGVFPQRNVGLEVNLSLSQQVWAVQSESQTCPLSPYPFSQ